MSLFILKHKECRIGRDTIYWNDIIIFNLNRIVYKIFSIMC
jgi:hypothetical protein